jgi:predicted aspartyl protease
MLRGPDIARGIILLAVFWLVAGLAAAQEVAVPFESRGKTDVILLEARVNGKPARLILDTGAAQTILSPQLVGIDPLEVKLSRFLSAGPGFRGEATWGTATLRLGKRVWYDRRVVVMNLEEVSRTYGFKVDGLVGQDILKEFETITIDYKKKEVHLVR